jgi:hypothetical protein
MTCLTLVLLYQDHDLKPNYFSRIFCYNISSSLLSRVEASATLEKTLQPGRFSSIKAAAKGHKINSISNVISIGLALTLETNEHCAAFLKSYCYLTSTYCLSSALPFRLPGERPKTPSMRLLQHDNRVKT